MAQYSPFDVNKHQQIFDSMYGAGMFNKGMTEANAIGMAEAQVKFAEQLYKQRLAEAEAQARARAEASRKKKKASETTTVKPSAKATGLGAQFQEALKNSRKTEDQLYREGVQKTLGKSAVLGDIVPMAQNSNVSTYDSFKAFQKDAKRVGLSKK